MQAIRRYIAGKTLEYERRPALDLTISRITASIVPGTFHALPQECSSPLKITSDWINILSLFFLVYFDLVVL